MFGEMMCFSERLLLRQREIVNAEGTRKVFKNNYGTWNFTEFLISLKIFLVINGLIKQKYLIYLKTQSCCKEKVVRVFPHLLTFNLTLSLEHSEDVLYHFGTRFSYQKHLIEHHKKISETHF